MDIKALALLSHLIPLSGNLPYGRKMSCYLPSSPLEIPSLANPPNAPRKRKMEKRKYELNLDNITRFNSRLPSLDNPPNAPRKKMEKRKYDLANIARLIIFSDGDEEETCYPYSSWRHLVTREEIREVLLRITPDDIAQMCEVEDILYWEDLYWLHSQPQTEDEHLYCDLIRQACRARCLELSLSTISQL